MILVVRTLFLSMLVSMSVYAQNSVGIGVANPNKNAVLELISPNNNQGLLVPKLTTAQRTATSFISGLTTKENGLLVFDSDDNTFYYWQGTVWTVFGGGLATPQDLKLTGNSLSITNNTSATVIDLSPYAGTSGAAGGDLTGTYPNPTIANNAIVRAKILDGSITSLDIADGTISSTDILNGTIANADLAANSVNTSNLVDGTIADADISNTANINPTKIAIGTTGQILTTVGGIAGWSNPTGTTLINDFGVRNLFAGLNVGTPVSATDGTDNAFYGSSAGAPNSTGDFNVAMGSQAGFRNTAGNLNVLIGWFAGSAVTTTGFNGNTMVGAQAGNNTVDGPNTFIGEKAGQNNTTGTLHTFIGNQTGLTNITGTKNTLLGYQSDVATDPINNATAIGYQAIVDASNKVRIGNTAITVIQGQVAFTAASDRRLKRNIQSLTTGLDFINKLRPVSYNMKNLDDNRINWGFLAQDIELLVGTGNAILTVGNDKDRTLGLRYTDFVAPLVKAVQEQQNEIETLNAKVGTLEAEIEQIKKAIGLKADLNK